MATAYPIRPKAPNIVRFPCMIFGLANIVSSVLSVSPRDTLMLVAGILVGSVWFAFGYYGGLPLVETVRDWHPPSRVDAVEEMHRQGLLVMRRRKWAAWLSMPLALAAAAVLVPLLMPSGHPEFIVLLLGVPLAIIQFRHYLSRCPRCGFGFFTKSSSRAALVRRSTACGHCNLSLHAYKNPDA